jgi:hypothetical protein
MHLRRSIWKQARFAQLFDLNTGCVVVQRSVKQLPWAGRLLKKANAWVKKGKHAIQHGHLHSSTERGRHLSGKVIIWPVWMLIESNKA